MLLDFAADYPWLAAPFFLAGFLSIVTYLVPVLLQNLVFDVLGQNLKKKYKVGLNIGKR